MAKTKEAHAHDYDSFPWKHLIGFVLSLVLTAAAVFVVLKMDFSTGATMWIITIFAIVQAVLQLVMFMHMTESEDGIWQTSTILYAAFIAAVVVVGSVWVMYFGIHRDHEDNSHMPAGQMEHNSSTEEHGGE